MKYLFVYAHPEPRSLNGSLKDHAVNALRAAGHEVVVSDLYAMKFKAVADGDDFPERSAEEREERLVYHRASGEAFHGGTQAADVRAEQDKLLWADHVILQFPLWWFSMPAILKGWVDRVFAHGFAIGVAQPGASPTKGPWARYGEGALAGRRAMVVTTTGARDLHFSARGLNGPIEDLLFPITHGMLFYVGLEVLPSFVIFRTVRLPEPEFERVANAYVARLLAMASDTPIPFRTENGGDFPDGMELDPALAPGQSGFDRYRT